MIMRKNYTRNKLAERINVKLGYSKEEAKEFIEVFLNLENSKIYFEVLA